MDASCSQTLTMTTTQFSDLVSICKPPVARITFQNPSLNIIDLTMMDELAQALSQTELKAEISTLVIAGSQQAFPPESMWRPQRGKCCRHACEVSHPIPCADQLNQSERSRSSRPLPRRRCELAMVWRSCVHLGNCNLGFPEIKLGCYPRWR